MDVPRPPFILRIAAAPFRFAARRSAGFRRRMRRSSARRFWGFPFLAALCAASVIFGLFALRAAVSSWSEPAAGRVWTPPGLPPRLVTVRVYRMVGEAAVAPALFDLPVSPGGRFVLPPLPDFGWFSGTGSWLLQARSRGCVLPLDRQAVIRPRLFRRARAVLPVRIPEPGEDLFAGCVVEP